VQRLPSAEIGLERRHAASDVDEQALCLGNDVLLIKIILLLLIIILLLRSRLSLA
jgi:hypothetical protein